MVQGAPRGPLRKAKAIGLSQMLFAFEMRRELPDELERRLFDAKEGQD